MFDDKKRKAAPHAPVRDGATEETGGGARGALKLPPGYLAHYGIGTGKGKHDRQEPTTEKRAADDVAADPTSRSAGIVEGDDAAMVVDDANQQRADLLDRAGRYVGAIRRAVDKFQSILRRRHAEAVIEKKIGWKLAGEKFKEHAIDYIKEKVGDGVKEIAKETETAPGLGTVVKVVSEAKGIVDDNAKANQAEAEVSSVDDIVIAMEQVCESADRTASRRIMAASPEELARWLAEPERLPNEAEIVARLDAMLLQAMRESGTQTVGESMAALKGREKLGEEIEAVNTKWGGGKK